MPRIRIRDAASQAQTLAQTQRQLQTSQYAAARFQEWAAGAQDREALMNARLQKAQSEAELAGAQFQYNLYKDNELRNQTTHYYTAMPQLQEQLKQNGIYPGSDRYTAEMAAFASTIPDALTHNDAIRKDLQDYTKVDETSARIHQMMAEQKMTMQQAQMAAQAQDLATQGQRPTSFSTSSKGVDVKASRPLEDVQKELKDAHGITRTQFETFDPNSAFRGTVDEKGGFSNNDTGTAIRFHVMKDGKANPVTMTVDEFNKYKNAFGQQPLQAPVQQGTQTPSQTNISTPVLGNFPVPSATPPSTGQTPALEDIFSTQQQTP